MELVSQKSSRVSVIIKIGKSLQEIWYYLITPPSFLLCELYVFTRCSCGGCNTDLLSTNPIHNRETTMRIMGISHTKLKKYEDEEILQSSRFRKKEILH